MKKNIKINQEFFDGSIKNYLMRNNNFTVGFNMPEALSGDMTFELPPYVKRMPYLVDKYPACPKEWMMSEGIVKSFFVPVIEGKGMWLDFNENNNHTHHIAIVISIQGVNPITGMPCKDAQLEQYIEECPKHKIKFGPDRYCSKCDYKWPKQNYITTTATPKGMFWLDGFRTIDGIVRQYILTAEKMKGVASNIIGKDRVYAIGLSFFVSKEKKPKQTDYSILRGSESGSFYGSTPQYWSKYFYETTPITPTVSPTKGLDLYTTQIYPNQDQLTDTICSDLNNKGGGTTSSLGLTSSSNSNSLGKYGDTKGTYAEGKESLGRKFKASSSSLNNVRSIQTKKLEIGAGAKINQSVYDDPERLDFWHDKPESIICINYCDEKSALEIIKRGEVDIEGHKEGFLKEVPVGN